MLWRGEIPQSKRGRPPKYSVDEIVEAAITVADRVGSSFSLRDVATELAIPVMSLYSYVDSREQLLELMSDEVCARMVRAPLPDDWRARIKIVADENLELVTTHRWLADRESERATLGPGTLAKYEHELAAIEDLDLTDQDKDAALTLVCDFVRASARALVQTAPERAEETPEQWWEREGAKLAVLGIEARFPLASRIGTAAGEAQGAARNSHRAYAFGLQIIIDGIAASNDRKQAA